VSGKYIACLALLAAVAAVGPAAGQTWDTTGNGHLNGAYYFRQVAWLGQADNINDLTDAAALYGTIVFDGQGHYTLQGAQFISLQNGGPSAYTFSQPGTYSLAASGYGFMNSFLFNNDTLNLLVANGVIIGSSTDNANGYNDLLIAAPVPSNANLQGTYSVIGVDSPPLVQGSVAATRAYSFSMNADGNGGIGNVQPTGYFAGSGSTLVKQGSISGIRYHMSNGAAVVQFAGELNSGNVTANLMSGQKYLYSSPDGNFIFGGSPFGWDMILGVRQNSGQAVNFSGLYNIGAFTQDDSPAASAGYVNLSSGYGSLDVLSNGVILGHQRVLLVAPTSGGPYDYTFSDAISQSSGVYTDSFTQYAFGGGGVFGIGFFKNPSLGVEVLVQQPQPAGQGVYIYPTGVVNAGSLAPFTASWAPGELVSIFGTNLSSKTQTDGTLPTTLAGVQVLVNGSPAPIYFVSPGQINAVIPLSITSATATIQVTNSAGASNTVANYIGQTAPGVFNSLTLPAVQHADYTMVTPTSPAHPGETLLVYLTGVGAVDSSGNATAKFTASIGGQSAVVGFAGTQSTVGGGYQINLIVPSGVTAGNVYLDISGPDAYNSEAVIPIGTAAAVATPQAMQRARGRLTIPQTSHRRQPLPQ